MIGLFIPLLIISIVTGNPIINLGNDSAFYYGFVHPVEVGFCRSVYIYKSTVLFHDSLIGSDRFHCEVIHLKNSKILKKYQSELGPSPYFFYQTFLYMANHIFSCALVIDDYVNQTYAHQNIIKYDSYPELFPGTKWCGVDHIASNYHDLGDNGKEDRCCRFYHICSKMVADYSNRTNYSDQRQCQICGEKYERCLIAKNTDVAYQLLYIYENKFKNKCLSDISNSQ